jgi:hypothetical protein
LSQSFRQDFVLVAAVLFEKPLRVTTAKQSILLSYNIFEHLIFSGFLTPDFFPLIAYASTGMMPTSIYIHPY